jgi:hypothetical protein
VLKFIETVFDLPCMTNRDCGANNMLNAFDMQQDTRPSERKLLLETRDCSGLPRKVSREYERHGTDAFHGLGD